MSAPLDDLSSYSAYVYSVADRHGDVTGSTLTLAPIGATLARLEGRIDCQDGLHLEIWELIDFAAHRIRNYSYEVYRDGEKICWYDPWPHPEVAALAATFPHHRHMPPDIRHHRMPARGISFEMPNLDVLLQHIHEGDFDGPVGEPE